MLVEAAPAHRASPGRGAHCKPPSTARGLCGVHCPAEMEVDEDGGEGGDWETKAFKRHKQEADILRMQQENKLTDQAEVYASSEPLRAA